MNDKIYFLIGSHIRNRLSKTRIGLYEGELDENVRRKRKVPAGDYVFTCWPHRMLLRLALPTKWLAAAFSRRNVGCPVGMKYPPFNGHRTEIDGVKTPNVISIDHLSLVSKWIYLVGNSQCRMQISWVFIQNEYQQLLLTALRTRQKKYFHTRIVRCWKCDASHERTRGHEMYCLLIWICSKWYYAQTYGPYSYTLQQTILNKFSQNLVRAMLHWAGTSHSFAKIYIHAEWGKCKPPTWDVKH